MSFSRAKRWYRIRSALVMRGIGSVVILGTAITLALLLSVLPARGNPRGGTLMLAFIDFCLFVTSPVLLLMTLFALFTGSAVDEYFKYRVDKKKKRAVLAARTKYSAKWR